ncbi:hypothetical protein F0U61_04690 [Archangium violaceum]|uniref:hypothetical protein n=1 Tax=Archangium violaceum TaxID=83451 RepID=UPI002B2F7289|nr:hypothetical protein F0U61_04690 [Archangium violaceum]
MASFFVSAGVRRGALCLLLGAGLLTGCGPSGRCDGTVGGTLIQGDIDGDSSLTIQPTTFSVNQSAHVRGAWLQLSYGEGALRLLMEIKLPAEQDTTELPLVMTEEEWRQRPPQNGAVSIWKLESPANAPALSGGTITVKLADANNLEGKLNAQFEDGSRLECTYDVRGKNFVPGDDPTYNGPP